MKGKIGLKKEVAEAVELAEFALELFDVNTADCLRLLGWRAWSYASPPRGAVCVRRSSGQGSPAAGAPNGRGCLPGLAIPRTEMIPPGPAGFAGLQSAAALGRDSPVCTPGAAALGQGRWRGTCAAAPRGLGKLPSGIPAGPQKKAPPANACGGQAPGGACGGLSGGTFIVLWEFPPPGKPSFGVHTITQIHNYTIHSADTMF